MWGAFFKALFNAILEYLRERELARAYEEALVENAKFDAAAAARAGKLATQERINREDAILGDDPAVLRERMRARDPQTN